jgi:hypothetical protein
VCRVHGCLFMIESSHCNMRTAHEESCEIEQPHVIELVRSQHHTRSHAARVVGSACECGPCMTLSDGSCREACARFRGRKNVNSNEGSHEPTTQTTEHGCLPQSGAFIDAFTTVSSAVSAVLIEICGGRCSKRHVLRQLKILKSSTVPIDLHEH